MKYKVLYNELEIRTVKNIFWHDTEAYEKDIQQNVCIGYRVDTGDLFETEAEAQAKADALNAEQENVKFTDEGDRKKEYYIDTDEIRSFYKD